MLFTTKQTFSQKYLMVKSYLNNDNTSENFISTSVNSSLKYRIVSELLPTPPLPATQSRNIRGLSSSFTIGRCNCFFMYTKVRRNERYLNTRDNAAWISFFSSRDSVQWAHQQPRHQKANHFL